jgi:hypothetical protein|tara:strand:+ start:854 stop:1102 length:249 start_codon:yes stop_codon:yes gene_type:complete
MNRFPKHSKSQTYHKTPKAYYVSQGGFRSVYDREYEQAQEDYQDVSVGVLRKNLERMEGSGIEAVEVLARCDALREMVNQAI